MPLSHDSKPRNKWRREKHATETALPYTMSRRSYQRRLLRRSYLLACLLDECTREVLKVDGRNWRWFEQQDRKAQREVRDMAASLLKMKLTDAAQRMQKEAPNATAA